MCVCVCVCEHTCEHVCAHVCCVRMCVCARACGAASACVLAGAIACDPQQRTLPTCAKSRRRCGRGEPVAMQMPKGVSPVAMEAARGRTASLPNRRPSPCIRRHLGRSRRRPGRRSTEREVHRPVGELPVPRLRRRPPSCRFRWPTMLPKWRLHFAYVTRGCLPVPPLGFGRTGLSLHVLTRTFGRRGTNDAPSPHETM